MRKMSMAPPKLAPLVGRASPAGSHNFGGVGKGIDMPNQSQKALGGQPRAPYKHETQQKGVISFGVAPYLK